MVRSVRVTVVAVREALPPISRESRVTVAAELANTGAVIPETVVVSVSPVPEMLLVTFTVESVSVRLATES